MSTTMTTKNQNGKTKEKELMNQTEQSFPMRQAIFSPRFDIWEGDEEFVLYGDLPGVDPENLDIEFEKGQLTVYGKVSRSHEATNTLRAEYGIGDFRRVFTVSEAIDSQGISAVLSKGELTIRMPKVEEARPRRIQVKTG